MSEPITPEQRLAEIRDLRVDSCSADAPYNPDVWALESARKDLLAEVDRLNAQIVTHDRLNRVAIGDWEREVARLKAENKRLRLDAEREEQATGNLIDERDNFHALLDRFAAAVAPIEVIGEHSSGNDPWVNALDMVTPAAEVDRLKAAVELLGGQLQGGAQAARDLARVIDVVALEIRRAVRLANAGDPAAAMKVITEFASEADWLDNLDADEGGEPRG
ncbi:hypothetical protein ACIBQX_11700 [Nonomuraea sp. NPDC049714]|uniref:hypothetical protein n=1 Tax=Nonomuraea sp. NPDC049714 TaxID=3364357 RepID=UPI0037896634